MSVVFQHIPGSVLIPYLSDGSLIDIKNRHITQGSERSEIRSSFGGIKHVSAGSGRTRVQFPIVRWPWGGRIRATYGSQRTHVRIPIEQRIVLYLFQIRGSVRNTRSTRERGQRSADTQGVRRRRRKRKTDMRLSPLKIASSTSNSSKNFLM